MRSRSSGHPLAQLRYPGLHLAGARLALLDRAVDLSVPHAPSTPQGEEGFAQRELTRISPVRPLSTRSPRRVGDELQAGRHQQRGHGHHRREAQGVATCVLARCPPALLDYLRAEQLRHRGLIEPEPARAAEGQHVLGVVHLDHLRPVGPRQPLHEQRVAVTGQEEHGRTRSRAQSRRRAPRSLRPPPPRPGIPRRPASTSRADRRDGCQACRPQLQPRSGRSWSSDPSHTASSQAPSGGHGVPRCGAARRSAPGSRSRSTCAGRRAGVASSGAPSELTLVKIGADGATVWRVR